MMELHPCKFSDRRRWTQGV